MAWQKGDSRPDGSKFLGKEIEFYRLVYDYLNSIRLSIVVGDNSRALSLIDMLERTFPYKDKEYLEEIKEAQAILTTDINEASDKFGKENFIKKSGAITRFTFAKYEALVRLFKRRKIFPQEAEEEWL